MTVNHQNLVMFFHLPKTGGSSIAKVLLDRNRGLDPIKSARDKVGYWRHENFHLSVSEASDMFGDELAKYFKFTCVRNPWDLEVSRYLYAARTNCVECVWAEGTFKEFIKIFSENQIRNHMNFDSLKLDGDVIMDYVMRFENLQEDFDTVCDKIRIPHRRLPHKNKSYDRMHYTEYYDDETRQIVTDQYAKDIEYFEYKFGE